MNVVVRFDIRPYLEKAEQLWANKEEIVIPAWWRNGEPTKGIVAKVFTKQNIDGSYMIYFKPTEGDPHSRGVMVYAPEED